MSTLALRSRFDLASLIAEAKRRARRRRLVTATVGAALVTGGLLVAMPTPLPLGSSAGGVPVSDGLLRAALPPGWSASVGPGFYLTHREAWVLVGDFRIPPGAAQNEGSPSVPSGRVVVTIGDFFPQGRSREWRTATSLQIPRAFIVSSRRWSVLYAGRAVSIKVIFGSGPTAALVRVVQRLLRGVRRVR
ncbi:MAG TPA: hypothetical protein VHX66_12405 [Solirubrobacteraceae bacterium]|nr:hypothetical protein [Solirubrobacteraceae bacterium]